ncbi:hypothetical protein [Owenweeksia hongkongensis]|uniref:hypothetical protein n=1 Tax=Owenweeksia hongkongensis TaxID=253245 RepID=UPI003A91D74A
MNRKALYLLLFVTFAFFSVIFFKTERAEYLTKESGINVIGRVLTRPECGRGSGTIELKIHKRILKVKIGKNDCIEGKYSIGDDVEVIYSAVYSCAVLPTSNTNFSFVLSIVFFLVPAYFLVLLIKPNSRKGYK